MKKVLIITAYFPPLNAADMQRVRMSLPYFNEFEWEATVVAVDEQYTDLSIDNLLLETLPPDLKVLKVKAFNKNLTSRFGLGSIALRSLLFYRRTVNNLLKKEEFNLIFFSTTQYPLCILGAYWKKKFKIPYVIDLQDPWHSDYYQDKPKNQRPAKYWFSYRLNKYLEPKALKHMDGLMSVSQSYIDDVKARYPEIGTVPSATITFGAFARDTEIALAHKKDFIPVLNPAYKNIVYAGRGGHDMAKSVLILFNALKLGIGQYPELRNIRFYFIGTSYAPEGKGKKTIYPVAESAGVAQQVVEITRRISFYHTLVTLEQADALFIPGSDDARYTASKIYPYLLTQKPVLAIFNKASSALKILKEYGVKDAYGYDSVEPKKIIAFFLNVLNNSFKPQTYDHDAIEKYSARQMAKQECALFDEVINK